MEYRVLARKYRPATFADLIGQEVLVRTLSNAIAQNRVAHAFLLTGIRGVGKTTTARIIARALNCEGVDGKGGPTIDACGVCAHCKMIAEDRHPDVLEMDAASRTGVNDIRELIDTVRYLPTSARTKIYIIDEVHMLSNSAFNALLKTLEEPPPHVKFIFATTEVRKIPVTILSRCQRFDLKRIETEMLAQHLKNIAEKEGVTLAPEALTLLGIAAEGSVRDALSLLDQAIAQGSSTGGEISAETVRAMLGMTGRAQTLELLEAVLKGECESALQKFRAAYKEGADPLLLLQDCLELTHFLTRILVVPGAGEDPAYSDHERNRAKALAAELSMPVITRLWQMLLKGVGEVKNAPSPLMAAEMVLVRACYAAELPTPAEVARMAVAGEMIPLRPPPESFRRVQSQEASAPSGFAETSRAYDAPKSVMPVQASVSAPSATQTISSFSEFVTILEQKREQLLASQLKQYASLVSFASGQLEIFMHHAVTREFSGKVAQALQAITGQEWKVLMAAAPGAPTLTEQENQTRKEQIHAASAHPLVASVMEHFPGAEVVDVKEAI